MTRRDSFLFGLVLVGFCGALAIADEPAATRIGQDRLLLTDICTRGFAASRRMPESESQAIKRSMLPLGHRMNEYELDHIVPLCLGGTNDRSNLQMQPIPEAREKDKLEWKACRMVCHGEAGLDEARGWFKRAHP